jgi:MoCo/4Fe-4S cofactor protein with predicted Tat translocation signal
MKRKFQHPEPSEGELSGPRYWRSLDELALTPGFQEQLAASFRRERPARRSRSPPLFQDHGRLVRAWRTWPGRRLPST